MDPTRIRWQSIVRGAYFEQMLLLPAALGEFRSNAKRMLGCVACFPVRTPNFQGFHGIPSFLCASVNPWKGGLFGFLVLVCFSCRRKTCIRAKGMISVYSIDPSSRSSFIKNCRFSSTQCGLLVDSFGSNPGCLNGKIMFHSLFETRTQAFSCHFYVAQD